jgi:hypothetical protein
MSGSPPTAIMILKHSQAKAVYTAMCALNKVNAKLDVQIPEGGGFEINVYEGLCGTIFVTNERGDMNEHINQAAFATAYGLITT